MPMAIGSEGERQPGGRRVPASADGSVDLVGTFIILSPAAACQNQWS